MNDSSRKVRNQKGRIQVGRETGGGGCGVRGGKETSSGVESKVSRRKQPLYLEEGEGAVTRSMMLCVVEGEKSRDNAAYSRKLKLKKITANPNCSFPSR